jgi:hypothetical protein
MTPKEKADQLVKKFKSISIINNSMTENESNFVAEKCALICVDEIISELNGFDSTDGYSTSVIDFYKEVKQEIEKL